MTLDDLTRDDLLTIIGDTAWRRLGNGVKPDRRFMRWVKHYYIQTKTDDLRAQVRAALDAAEVAP